MKKHSSFFCLLIGPLFASALIACSPVGPDYQPPHPVVPGGWNQTTTDFSGVTAREITAWWQQFNDPLLNSLIGRVESANTDLRIAETRIREARAQRTIAGAEGRVDASAAATRSRKSFHTASAGGTNTVYEAGFDAGWEVDIFGGVQRAVEAADASLEASHEDLRNILISLQAEVARNYLELRGSQQRLAVARETIAAQEKYVELVQGRLRAGLGNELDLANAQTDLATTRSQIPALRTIANQAICQLAVLLGQPPTGLFPELAPEAGIPPVPEQIPVNLPSELLRQRPDIRAAERRLAAATAEIGVATADLFPRFSLSALLGVQSIDLANLVTSGSRYWSVGPALQLSLFDQGKARAGIEIRNAQRDAALHLYEKAVLTALAEGESALTAFSQEKETRRTLVEAVAAGKKALDIADGLYRAGLTDFLHVLQTEHASYQSEDQLVQSTQRLALDMVALFKAFGGGWQTESLRQTSPSSTVSAATATHPLPERHEQ